VTYQAHRDTAESIADESLIWAMNTVDRINGKGTANCFPEQIAAFAKVYVQSYNAGIMETLAALAQSK
jgi:hypothetical protein